MKEWRYRKDSYPEKSLIERLALSRGIKEEDVNEFLNPLEMNLTSPNVFLGMERCVERISKAIDDGEKILIHGDFDADGVTSTSLLYKTFKFLDADVHYFIPHREKEGHGLNTKALVKLMTNVKPKLIISCDCGISDVDAVNFLNSFKIDVIITDHHEAPEVLPKAYSIINPKAPNALSENLSAKQIIHLTSLAGVGVAFKVAQAVLDKYNKLEFISQILPFVAVGTVADLVPLVGENRYFVLKGLDLISQGKHYGLTTLLNSAGYSGNITSEHIAYGIAPRINASGRLDTVDAALKVLISDNRQEIAVAVQSLNEFNRIRQELGQQIFAEADEMFQKEKGAPAIVLFKEDWHIGIIGIVASMLVEKYYKPVFLMTYSKDTNQYRCSARSIEGINLYNAISANADLLDTFGGHSMAAGLSFSKHTFDEVKKALCDTIKDMSQGLDLRPFLNIDLTLTADDLTVDFVNGLSKLEPFGANNPSPIFVINNLKIKEKRLMGENNNHLSLMCTIDNKEFKCIRWQEGDIGLEKGDTFDFAFHPQINEYKGVVSVQLIYEDIHSEYLKEEVDISRLKLYDHRKKTDIMPLVNDYVKNSKHDILIFAESKKVIDALSTYKDISSKIITRDNLRHCDSLMFFDYPADKTTFERILKDTNAIYIHFMKYDFRDIDEEEFLKTSLGMLRYAHKNGGRVELTRFASSLGVSYEVLDLLFLTLEETGIIEIKDKQPEFYTIKLGDVSDISRVLHNNRYQQIVDLYTECNEFRKSLLQDELYSIVNI